LAGILLLRLHAVRVRLRHQLRVARLQATARCIRPLHLRPGLGRLVPQPALLAVRVRLRHQLCVALLQATVRGVRPLHLRPGLQEQGRQAAPASVCTEANHLLLLQELIFDFLQRLFSAALLSCQLGPELFGLAQDLLLSLGYGIPGGLVLLLQARRAASSWPCTSSFC